MFSKNDRDKRSASASSAGGFKAAPSIISVNLHIIGNLSTDGEVQVDGSIEGDITSQSLTVGEKASISGEIFAEDVEIHGAVSGKIRAGNIRIAKTARVIGDIWHEILSVESGAYIEGQLTRAKNESADQEIARPFEMRDALAPEPAAQPGSGGEAGVVAVTRVAGS